MVTVVGAAGQLRCVLGVRVQFCQTTGLRISGSGRPSEEIMAGVTSTCRLVVLLRR